MSYINEVLNALNNDENENILKKHQNKLKKKNIIY